ncbi:hypothetical protein sscle_09g073800 [Sclerotinia sclerotiorum 1980 UF-70]|uniref:Uncharacterized protein n=1 Tax=Sclerotinia sclerotiorum (strain ATCC 18683 / 1980 / Ss-1) TaxID=665079 RepID=A0A1D9QCD5_SCLS1|nr:hypothetical protein sscle_09g073800 [Sclerotinia sclerotiorum 1980 UF-70]
MGNTSSHQSISPSTSTPTSQTSSSNSSTKSPKHFHIHSHPFSHHRRVSSANEQDEHEHGALLRDNRDRDSEEGDDGTYLLRRGSFESRDEWMERKRIIASRIRGNSESEIESEGGVKM